MVDLNDLIQVYENALDAETCDMLVLIFDQTSNYHERVTNDGKFNFTQLNLTANKTLSNEIGQIHNHVIRKVVEYRDKYYEFIDNRVFPIEHAFEMFHIKKYNSDGDDYSDTHVDVTDHASSRRFLHFLWYLNDVDSGGNTTFRDLTISPKRGKLVVFPPLWMYPYREDPPATGPKYIMSSYLHYK